MTIIPKDNIERVSLNLTIFSVFETSFAAVRINQKLEADLDRARKELTVR